jgi:hypothetical protein
MRKTSKSSSNAPSIKKQEIHEDVKMIEEEKKDTIDLEETIEKEMNKGIVINLDKDKSKKAKKEYDIVDTVIKEITVAGDIHVRLISNINGYFVDIRKYFKKYPTKKGIRILASKYVMITDLLRPAVEKLTDLNGLENKNK